MFVWGFPCLTAGVDHGDRPHSAYRDFPCRGHAAATAVNRGAIVTVRARDVAPEMAAARSFAGDSHRFLKRIAALEGDEVCGDGSGVRINGGEAFPLQREASTSLMLQVWTGCRRLMFGEALLLGDTPDSFDGRYWGPIDARLIEGVWRKL